MQEHPRVDSEGKTGGYFSTNVQAVSKDGANAIMKVHLSSFGCGKAGRSNITKLSISSSTEDVEQAKLLLPIADEILRQHGFYDTNKAYNVESALRELGVEVATFLKENSATYPQTENQPTAIFSASTQAPTSRYKSFLLNVVLHPTSHIRLAQTTYVPSADYIQFSLQTDDKEVAKDILEASIQFLERMGLKDYLLKTKTDTSKIIPPEWVDLDRIKTSLSRSGTKYIPIAITQVSRKQNIPYIAFSSGTTEKQTANEMARLLKEEWYILVSNAVFV